MKKLSHVDERGRAHMVDVGDKPVTARVATATGSVRMSPETLRLMTDGRLPKGDVLAVARVAGMLAAKKTPELIPLCHPLPVSSIDVEFTPHADSGRLDIEARVKVSGKTGVEMEALTAVSVAALTVYDMCKAVQKDVIISDIGLQHKSGGKSGIYTRPSQGNDRDPDQVGSLRPEIR